MNFIKTNIIFKFLVASSLLITFLVLALISPLKSEAITLGSQYGYEWLDKGTIQVQFEINTDRKNVNFVDASPNDNILEYVYTDKCGKNILRITKLNAPRNTSWADATFYIGPDKDGKCGDKIEIKQSDGTLPLEIKLANNYSKAPSTGVSTVNPEARTMQPEQPVVEETPTSPDCQSSGFTLSWIACPIVDGLAKAVDGIYAGLIRPLLVTKPIDTSGTSKCEAKDTYRGCDYAVWSQFRIYGNVILVIALLVIVLGQSIGGGLVDAYTAKKVLPRLLAAAVLINLSIYIVALLVDITNILGNGVQALITQPFNSAGSFKLTLNAGSSAAIGSPAILAGGLGIAALLGAGGTIWAAIVTIASPVLPALVGFLALFVLLPAILIMIAILATVIIRNGLLIFLVMTAPVAFALYCLPNTEKYFKKWWELLWKTLLIYPIIAVIFAIGDILAITMSQGGSSNGLLAVIAQLLGVMALIAPLFLIPFAFKIAGGIIGRVYDASNKMRLRGQEAIKGNANLPNSLRNRVKGNLAGASSAAGAQSWRKLDSYYDKSFTGTGRDRRPSMKGRAAGRLAGVFAGSVEKEALQNQKSAQRFDAVTGNGDDTLINARTSWQDDDGNRWTLDGKSVTDPEYRAAKKQYPSLSEAQASAAYRSKKINTTEDAEMFTSNFAKYAEQEKLTAEQATGQYTGLAFARQNERGEFKFGKFSKQDDGSFQFKPVGGDASFEDGRAQAFVKKEYSGRGSYAGSQLLSSHFQALGDVKQGHVSRIEAIDQEVDSMNRTGVLTQDQQSRKGSLLQKRQSHRDELKQIYEIQDAFTTGQQIRDPENPGGVIMSGMSGANAETKAAFDKLISMDKTPTVDDSNGNRVQPNGPQTKAQTLYSELRKEIDSGDTYEAGNSRKYGNAP